MAKQQEKKKFEERIYTIPLRREFHKVPQWKRTKKAVTAAKEFLVKHMKSENVKLGKEVNEYLWQRGLKNPPHKVKVVVTKDEKGMVMAELFGMKKEATAKKQEKQEEKQGQEKAAPQKKPIKKEELAATPESL